MDSSTLEMISKGTDNKEDQIRPQRGDQCQGEQCKRVYDIYGKRKWSFKTVENCALSDTCNMKSPVRGSARDHFSCKLCGKEQEDLCEIKQESKNSPREGGKEQEELCEIKQEGNNSPREDWKVDNLSRTQSCCWKPRLCRGWMKWSGTPEFEYYWPGERKHNPIWSGDDPDQIGIFIRNLTVLGINERSKTMSVRFYLNIVWLDEGFCDWAIKQNKEIQKALGLDWYMQLRTEDYEKRYEQYLETERKGTDWRESLIGTKQQKPEKQYSTLPSVVMWNLADDGYKEIENLISLNKKHIGKNTVYWRRLIQASFHVNFHSRSFPFGYESFRLKIRLLSWTRQHLVLLRTKLWYDQHLKVLNGSSECNKNKDENVNDDDFKEHLALNELLAVHSFSYIHPDNSRIPDWKVCSVHGRQDQWISSFDNNELEFRLPVRVTRGLDTQSCFEALIVLKHHPDDVLWNSWYWFSLTPILALLTYRVHPDQWEGRLEITVAVIFVQMNLRSQSCQNYPRIGQMTALDIHISLSILIVVLQAFVQCLIRYAYAVSDPDDAETYSENLDQIDHAFGWVNLGLVILTNLATWGLAKYRQRFERLRVESRIRWYTGFNQEPLGQYEKGKIEQSVAVKEMECGSRLQVYDEVLNRIEMGRGRTDTSINSPDPLIQTATRTMCRIKI